MKILILSWRDIKSPFSGGAEIFTYENARRWVTAGHEVTWFSSDFGNCPKEEIIEGIKIIRRGTEITVHYQAFRHYKKNFKGKFDLVIDQINTIPFLTPLYVKEKKAALIFQLAREVWFYETFFPLSLIGFAMEFFYLKLYRRIPVLTISESTKQDLLKLGFNKEISILPVGIPFEPLEEPLAKDFNPSLIFVGRLRKSKRIHHIIEALQMVKKDIPEIQLKIVGSGGKPGYAKKLKRLVKKYNLGGNITFYGHVNEETKRDLIKNSHLIILASVREGWGIVVSEANALSTPAVAYNIHGVRDAIIDWQTGLLTKKNNPQVLSEGIITLLTDRNLYAKMKQTALNKGKEFSWDKSAEETLAILNKDLSGRENTRQTKRWKYY